MPTKQYRSRFKLQYGFTFILTFLFFFHALAQTKCIKDSSKAKTAFIQLSIDSISKYGTAKLVLLRHTKTIPMPALQDADQDGIPDQLDLEPNTPEGADVDSHGRALDTDGDGMPDYKDKEKLTLQKCFPVDSNGVGRCPELGCCKEVSQKLQEMDDDDIIVDYKRCTLDILPSIKFSKGLSVLNTDAIRLLTQVANLLQNNPRCNVRIVGYYGIPLSKKSQHLTWDRVHAIIKYLVEKQGLNETRCIFMNGDDGNNNSVDLIPTAGYNPDQLLSPSPRHY